MLPKHEGIENAVKLKMIPPTTGVHKLGKRQAYYEEVHWFLQHRRWEPIRLEEGIGGTTWLELLALFDCLGYRSPDARLAKDDVA